MKNIDASNSLHTEDWDFYTSTLNNIKSSILINLGVQKIAPIEGLTYLVQITLTMNKPGKEGLSSDEEYEKLNIIEDSLKSLFLKNNESVYIGRLTWNKQRFYYFYVNDPTPYEKAISKVMENFTDYQYEKSLSEDPSWETYFDFLYPTALQLQLIQNRRIIQYLESEGDSLEKERPIYHWLYFNEENDRTNFINEIKEDDFEVNSLSKDEELVNPYVLCINRTDYADLNSINDITTMLFALADENNGEYNGWETSVENKHKS